MSVHCKAQNVKSNHQLDTYKLKLLHDYVQWTYNYASQKEFDSSNVYSKRALEIAKELKNEDLIGYAKTNTASNLFFQTNTEDAKLILQENISNPSIHDSIKVETFFWLEEISHYERKFKEGVTYLISIEKLIELQGLNSRKDSLRISAVKRKLGTVYKELKEFKKAHQYYNEALKYLKDENRGSYIIYYSAELFEEENKINEAIRETQKALKLVSKGSEGKLYRPTYYLKLSNLYLKINKADSAVYYANQGVKDNDDCQLDLLNMALGDSYFFKQEYRSASKYYNTSFKTTIAKETELKIHKKLRDNYIKLGNYKKALEHNSSFLKLKDSLDGLRVDQEIAEITEKYESNKKQLKIDRLELEDIKKTTLINKQHSKIVFGSTILVFSLLILGLLFIYYFQQKKQKHQLFTKNLQLVKELNQNYNKGKEKRRNYTKINDSKLEKILTRIEDLINDEFFLNSEMTLNSLAKLIDTNTTYLSKIINDHYNKTFSNFINELRIAYALKKLETEQNYHKLTIDHIAEKVGFASSSTFYSAFKKFTGLTPSYYIKKRISEN